MLSEISESTEPALLALAWSMNSHLGQCVQHLFLVINVAHEDTAGTQVRSGLVLESSENFTIADIFLSDCTKCDNVVPCSENCNIPEQRAQQNPQVPECILARPFHTIPAMNPPRVQRKPQGNVLFSSLERFFFTLYRKGSFLSFCLWSTSTRSNRST